MTPVKPGRTSRPGTREMEMTTDDDLKRYPFGRPHVIDPEAAARAMATEQQAERDYQRMRVEQLSRARRHITVGIVLLVVGLVITIGSAIAAGPGGGYVAAVGAIVYGLVTLLRGVTVRHELGRR